ncbi:sensor histidine kinase [Desulfocurvibacter africanus]|uniref:sensor histidine kinase n=1 Tax=Desulfocurvibacter africanus TaxID=873 RepID=UPI0005500D02|nr:ATP-binding protein [Desulfocurvibacter africanus]
MPVRLLHSTTFRFSLLYMLLFGASVLMLLGYIYWTTAGFMERQTDETIAAEVLSLSEQYRLLGLGGIQRSIAKRLSAETGHDSFYLLADNNLRLLAGNLPSDALREIVPIINERNWLTASFRIGRRHVPIRFHLVALPGNYTLMVGRDITDLRLIQTLIIDSLIWGLAMTMILGLVGGLVMSRGLLSRLESINRTSRGIMEGELSRRVPTDGSGDEFDQLALNLNRMLDQIEVLLASIRQVSDNIAHDLRTPLNRLRSRLEVVLLEERDQQTYREALERTIAETEDILGTFNALLRIAQAEAGTSREDSQLLDMACIVGDAVELYAPLAEEQGLALRTELSSGLTVRGNRHLLSQAVANLLDNAIKYTPEGGEVLVSLTKDGNGCLLSVADTGPGVPEAERGKVLTRFYRLEHSRSTPGSGLGLSLVAAVARLHKASLSLADNRPGEPAPGLRVDLFFPNCV